MYIRESIPYNKTDSRSLLISSRGIDHLIPLLIYSIAMNILSRNAMWEIRK